VPKKEDLASELSAWRATHLDELEMTLRVFREIRDDPEASNKDRIEAGKSVGRLLAVMSPERVSSVSSEEKESMGVVLRNKPELSPALKRRLKAIVNASV
jgi:hypothetical protein